MSLSVIVVFSSVVDEQVLWGDFFFFTGFRIDDGLVLRLAKEKTQGVFLVEVIQVFVAVEY